jgi:competence protein ComEA
MNLIKSICVAVLMMLSVSAWAGNVNINTADAKTLASELTGVGEKKAEAIVAYRKANGNFKTADDLTRVKGIGSNIVEKNRNKIAL